MKSEIKLLNFKKTLPIRDRSNQDRSLSEKSLLNKQGQDGVEQDNFRKRWIFQFLN